MPEIKNTFIQGKMNKDLDERLVPSGQYRHAKNIEVSSSEDSDVGVVKNILGNHRVEDKIGSGYTCVGSVANEKTNKLYWFVSTYNIDAIYEYDVKNDVTLPVLVDTKAGTSKAVLKFFGNIITGINIIDNLLFWTDNNSEPKKINIDDCKAGTNINGNLHTKLIFENGSFEGVTIDKVSNSASQNNFLERRPEKGKYFWVARRPFVEMVGGFDINGNDVANDGFDYNYSINNGYVFKIRHYRNNVFLGVKEVRFFGNTTQEVIAADPTANTNGTVGRLNIGATDDDFEAGDVFFGDNIELDIEEKHITVIKPKPLNVLSFKINHEENINSNSKIPNLFETKFPRFSYRYKYKDGEFSPFAPFTSPIFNPKYTKDVSVSLGEKDNINIVYNKDNAYSVNEPHNKAMVNSINSVELTDFINSKTLQVVSEVEILYKQEDSNVIYSIATIKHVNKEWHQESNLEGSNIGYNDAQGYNFESEGGSSKGKYIVTTENIYAALPANQLLRPWDNVPKKALAQEITGNRIVYGNYVQNYEINNNVTVVVSADNRDNFNDNFETKGLPSIKSQRNYQLGVAYCDKYGRETPVFTSNDGALNIPWQDNSGNKNASKSLQLAVSTPTNFPEWVDSLKFFVKENSNPYYNLLMERAWVTKKTYELDNSEGHMWLCFPSSDRNKITEDDYITFKKKIGPGEQQVSTENKYKVIDIKNEAPDAIKYELVVLGSRINATTSSNNGLTDSSTTGILSSNNADIRPDQEGNDTIHIIKDGWLNPSSTVGNGALNEESIIDTEVAGPIKKDLYISWGRTTGTNTVNSKKYKVVGGHTGPNSYVLKLNQPITKKDADVAHKDGNCNLGITGHQKLHADLVFYVEQRKLKEQEDFSGKFFVKISKNKITDLLQSTGPIDVRKSFAVTSSISSWYWQDNVGTTAEVDFNDSSNTYGMTNWDGFGITYSSSSVNHIQNAQQKGGVNNQYNFAIPNELKVTDYAEAWEYFYTDSFGPTFFVDGMYMAAGQSDNSNYAKFGCINWSGNTVGETDLKDESCWSYPPFKTWLSENKDIHEIISGAKINDNNSIWYDEKLISVAPDLEPHEDYNDLKIDGWIGPLQKVSRFDFDNDATDVNNNHVNGLEGFVTTTEKHSKGPRRWLSGITGSKTKHGVGSDTKTYAKDHNDIGRHFMHLSFFAPGKDLHPKGFSLDTGNAMEMIYGPNSFMANLQGIWGGGVFTGESKDELFASSGTTDDSKKYQHFPMEGNYDNYKYVSEPPGPGVGFGYDLEFKELHERQWDPTFNRDGDPDNKIRDFIRNLFPGSKFRFARQKTVGSTVDELIDNTIYTIKSVQIKKLYNHTSWRKHYNRFHTDGSDVKYIHANGEQDEEFRSVEEAAMLWLNSISDGGERNSGNNGGDALSGISGPAGYGSSGLIKKINDFAAAHNRRVCYIIELDKNPTDSNSALGNPISAKVKAGGVNAPDDCMNADSANDNFCDIEFLQPVQDLLLSDLSKFPAIWEIDPKKQEVDLDIYYEASNHIPVRLNIENNEIIAPIGCKVEVLNSSETSVCFLNHWSKDNEAVLTPGFKKGSGNFEIDYSGMSFKFTKADGSYNIIQAGLQDLDGVTTGLKTNFIFRDNIGDIISSGLSWNNCFSFGNGIESNRVRDDFNEPFISNGVKASTTTQEVYREERRKNGLIYSGIYNSDGKVNDLNQFIMAEKITKDINPTYGSIQKLFSRDTDLVTFCEDKVVKVLANKDALFNADGNTNLTAVENVLGQTIPFIGEYGISTNPESFASESYRAYFADKQRGSVIRLSRDGLTPISKAGMNDWFRDNLKEYNTLIGTYDNYKENYNLTLSNKDSFVENFILDSYLEVGEELESYAVGSLNIIENPGVNAGVSFNNLYENYNVVEYENANNPFDWSTFTYNDYNFTGSVRVVHHAEILAGDLQEEVTSQPAGVGATAAVWTATVTDSVTNEVLTFTGPNQAAAEQAANDAGYTVGVTYSNFVPANFTTANNLMDSGWWYDPRFTNYNNDLFGDNRGETITALQALGSNLNKIILADGEVSSSIVRKNNGTTMDEDNLSFPYTSWTSGYDPSVEKPVFYSANQTGSFTDLGKFSRAVTRNNGTDQGSSGAIVFDRCNSTDSWVEFRNIGSDLISAYGPGDNGVLNEFVNNGGDLLNQAGDGHDTIYNGDEIYIQFEINVFPTRTGVVGGGGGQYGTNLTVATTGYNHIRPKIELYNGNNLITSDVLCSGVNFNHYQSPNINYSSASENYRYADQQSGFNDLGGDFEDYNTDGASGDYESASGSTYKCIKQSLSSSGEVIFPDTHGDTRFEKSHTSSFPSPISVRCGVGFKFRSPTQQKSNGKIQTGYTNIEEEIVVEDLRIRISNDRGPGTYNYNYTAQDGVYVLRYQLWELKNIFVKKGYSIISPSVDPQQTSNVSISTSQTALANSGSLGRAAVNPVPTFDVPAWTEIIHNNLSGGWYLSGVGSPVNGSGKLQQVFETHFGPNYNAVTLYGDGQNPAGQHLPPVANAIEYVVPEDWQHLPTPSPAVNSPYGTTGSTRSIPGVGIHGSIFNRVNAADNNYVAAQQSYDNEFIEFTNPTGANNDNFDINIDITSAPWVSGNWYLVDVEFLRETGTNGEPTNPGDPDPTIEYSNLIYPNGQVLVMGAAATYAAPYVGNTDIDPDYGVGKFSGVSSYAHVMLVPTLRTEYGGTPEVVLRGIFKVDASSSVIINQQVSGSKGTSINELTIRSYNMNNSIRISKIIAKKLSGTPGINDWINNSGSAAPWTSLQASSSGAVINTQHGFDVKHVYLKNSKLNFEIPSTIVNGNYNWTQEFGTSTTQPAPTISVTGWELEFDVHVNQQTGNFSGSFDIFLGIDNGSGAPEGLYVSNIQDTGSYAVKFNFNGDVSNYITSTTLSAQPWTFLRGDLNSTPTLDYTTQPGPTSGSTGSIQNLSSVSTSADFIDKIQIIPTSSQSVNQEYSINKIRLIDTQSVFTGGLAGSWSFSGFDTSKVNYIFWNNNELNLHFNECPGVGNVSQSPSFININQRVEKTIKRFEKYKIRLQLSMLSDQVKISVYYYNSNGFGFKISDIDPTTGVSIGQVDSYGNDIKQIEEIKTIGGLDSSGAPIPGSIWQNINSKNSSLAPDLKNYFVISVEGNDQSETIINGTIDNIEMLPFYDIPNFVDTTITFSEKVNGWTSFKSFIPENGLSISKKYFTFDQGQLYEHYVPKVENLRYYGPVQANGSLVEWHPKDADNYNVFYGVAYDSNITTVLNNEPSLVKTFNTINYEGTQSYITKPVDFYHNGSIVYTAQELVDINNSKAFAEGNDIQGWQCVDISTDLDVGTLKDFIKKEGKWFNYIKGKISNVNTSLFSTQGVGIISSVDVNTSIINSPTVPEQFQPTAVVPGTNITIPITTSTTSPLASPPGTNVGSGGGGTSTGGGGGY